MPWGGQSFCDNTDKDTARNLCKGLGNEAHLLFRLQVTSPTHQHASGHEHSGGVRGDCYILFPTFYSIFKFSQWPHFVKLRKNIQIDGNFSKCRKLKAKLAIAKSITLR